MVQLVSDEDDGLIPAHAGKTPCRPLTASMSAAHPRSRGENATGSICVGSRVGSSPLTRGKHLVVQDVPERRRLIPAHAGKTRGMTIPIVLHRAHPRSRGENARRTRSLLGCGGSSPLTRGKPSTRRNPAPTCRLIPAHAGKTVVACRIMVWYGAHPRSRGENAASALGDLGAKGSSPLTRGKLCGVVTLQLKARLIPAHAGKTSTRKRSHRAARAHPRSRGENRGLGDGELGGVGSSPLTRGKLFQKNAPLTDEGLIPAHAGKTVAAPRPP